MTRGAREARPAGGGTRAPHVARGDAAAAPTPPGPRFPLGAAALALALALGTLAYAPSLDVPFQFDDYSFVRDNPALRALWPPGHWIHSRWQETRPLASLSFALNYAWSRTRPWSYHLVNLALHLACVALLFVFVRRTLRRLDPPWPARADAVAGAASLLLAVHTVQSESVIYIQGRPGLLAALFGLGALATTSALLPGWERARARGPRAAAAAALTALAMLSKESAAVLPALLLLYDWAVVARGRFAEVRPRLLAFHLPQWAALAVPVLVFATLRNPHRGVFGFGTVDAASFYLTQPKVLLLYLRLFLRPAGLSIDRGADLAGAGDPGAWLALAAVLALIGLTLRTLRRAPWAGYCAAWWLAAVSPTSLIPNHEFVAERYLTFATPALAALAAWGAAAAWAAFAPARARAAAGGFALALCGVLAIPLAWHTQQTARLWRSGTALWRQAVTISPRKPRPWFQYAWFLWHDADYEEAERAARRGIELDPRDHRPRSLLSRIQADLGQADSALASARAAETLAPHDPETLVTLALALMQARRWPEAMEACDRALRADSTALTAFYSRAQCRAQLGDTAQARADGWWLETRRPDLGAGPFVLGMLEHDAGRDSAAAGWLRRAIEREPDHIEALRLYPQVLFKLGRTREALEGLRRYFAATRAERTDYAMLYYTAMCQQALGEDQQAVETLRTVTRMRPQLAPAWIELAYTLAATRDSALRDSAGARAALAEGLRLADPRRADLRARAGQVREALEPRP